jgi:hypothetical protein
MLTTLWWIGDAILIVVVFPVVMLLTLRIIRGLVKAHRALVSISRSAREITGALPAAATEISAAAQAAETLAPANIPVTTG